MSTHTASGLTDWDTLLADVTAAIRAPEGLSLWDAATDSVTYTFTPDLTTAEATVFDDLASLYRQRTARISLAEWQVLKPKLVEIRALRLRTPAQWSALSASQRESDEVTWLRDLTDVLRALLRD